MNFLSFLLLIFSFLPHELHLSMCDISYNQQHERIEIQQRIFYDDLELNLRNELDDQKFDILEPFPKYDLDSLYTEYLNNRITLGINGQEKKLELLDYEMDDEAYVFYLYIDKVSEIKTMSILSTIFFELFEDQANIVSVRVNNTKKSGRFLFGSKPLSFKYND